MNFHQPAMPAVLVTIVVIGLCLAFVAYVWLTTFGPLAPHRRSSREDDPA